MNEIVNWSKHVKSNTVKENLLIQIPCYSCCIWCFFFWKILTCQLDLRVGLKLSTQVCGKLTWTLVASNCLSLFNSSTSSRFWEILLFYILGTPFSCLIYFKLLWLLYMMKTNNKLLEANCVLIIEGPVGITILVLTSRLSCYWVFSRRGLLKIQSTFAFQTLCYNGHPNNSDSS